MLIDKAILLTLTEEPFAPLRRTASKTLIPRTTVHPHLVGPLGMTVTHLRWVPHRPSPQQKGSRVQRAQEPLAVLKSAKHNSWKNIITLTESFFYIHTDSGQMWLPRNESPEIRERHMISSEKLTVTIAWNPDGLHGIEVLPKGHEFDVDYHCSSVLTKLSKITRQFRNETREN
jgi:hypothetical protein